MSATQLFVKNKQLLNTLGGTFYGEKQRAVEQNIYFQPHLFVGRWVARILRSWYAEVGTEIRAFEKYLGIVTGPKARNFTQMSWPLTEFIGCGVAQLKEGYFVTCYYHPPPDLSNTDSIKQGKPCTQCDDKRPMCSRMFLGLCGIDIEMTATYLYFNSYLYILTTGIFIFYNLY